VDDVPLAGWAVGDAKSGPLGCHIVTEAALTEHDESGPRAIAAERMTFFADAVIAIAITLLALELPVPKGDAIKTNAQLWSALSDGRQEYVAFLISFVVIGGHWSAHHRIFRYVTRIGGGMTGLSLSWLLMIVITPFATRLLSSGDGAFQVRFGIYAGIQAAGGLIFIAMVAMVQTQRLYRPDTPPHRFANAYWGVGALAAGFLISIPVSFFAANQAYDLWILVPLLTAVVRRRILAARARRPVESGDR
jgi:uncharacterized membrane protein